MKINFLFFLFVGLLCASQGRAQQILFDRVVRAGELTLFPELNSNNYYYLPDKVRLGRNEQNKPQLSFLRYAKNEKTAATDNTAITESAEGGGVLHALVELYVPDDMKKRAEQALRRIDGDGKIVGPVMFKSGTVNLISSIAKPGGEMAKQVVGIGTAPVLENQKVAVSIQLNKLGSKILWETFKTPTPDLSFTFEMEVQGYLSPKRVMIEANFERIYKNQTIEAAVATPVLAGEINAAFDDLSDSGAIKVTQIGNDESLERLKETAYNQLLALMFDRVAGTGIPQLGQLAGGNSRRSMLDRATESLQRARQEAREENRELEARRETRAQREREVRADAQRRADTRRREGGLAPRREPPASQRRHSAEESGSSGNGTAATTEPPIPDNVPVPGMAAAVSYQMKRQRQTGVYKIDLNKYTEETRTLRFDYNPGGALSGCAECFREVNLDDPLMKQREVNATLSGVNNQDFTKYINFVNVLVRKKHQNGEVTPEEIKIDKSVFNQQGNFFKAVYGWKGDNDRAKWLQYEYRTLWSFFGGYEIPTEWANTEFGSITLNPPFVRKQIYLEVDPEFVAENNVRGVEVTVYSKLKSDKVDMQRFSLKTSKEELSRTVEILVPQNVEDYEYEVTYLLKGADSRNSAKKSSKAGQLYIDRFL
jgi:hypothetical protein